MNQSYLPIRYRLQPLSLTCMPPHAYALVYVCANCRKRGSALSRCKLLPHQGSEHYSGPPFFFGRDEGRRRETEGDEGRRMETTTTDQEENSHYSIHTPISHFLLRPPPSIASVSFFLPSCLVSIIDQPVRFIYRSKNMVLTKQRYFRDPEKFPTVQLLLLGKFLFHTSLAVISATNSASN
jgi:hypothetical protein